MKGLKRDIQKIVSEPYLADFESSFKKSIEDIRSWNPEDNFNKGLIDVLDFFSGCGGMSMGFSAIANSRIFNLIGAVDINEKALESYKFNFKAPTLRKNIKELCNRDGIAEIKEKFNLPKKKERPLVIIGCAPCQGFTAHRKKNWEKPDERNTLIGAFTETAINLDPDFIVMENVPEILGEKYWEHYNEAKQILEKKGYIVKQTIYNSASFGVPQARNRAIIIAAKIHFNLPIPILDKKNFVTVRDAIFDLPKVKAGEILKVDKFHRSARHKSSTIETISKVPKDGGSRPAGVGPKCLEKVNGFADVYGRLAWDKPSITLTQYARNPASGRFTHPEQNRGLTIREASRLQSFPDNYDFCGSLDQCFKQIGESVPPYLSVAIACQVLRAFNGVENELELIAPLESPVKSSFYAETPKKSLAS